MCCCLKVGSEGRLCRGGLGRGYFNSKCIAFWSPADPSHGWSVISEVNLIQGMDAPSRTKHLIHTRFEVEIMNV